MVKFTFLLKIKEREHIDWGAGSCTNAFVEYSVSS
jgi:hypothetical protein